MGRYSRRKILVAGGTVVSAGVVGCQMGEYTKARIESVLSPLPGIRATGKPLTVRKEVASKDIEFLPKTDQIRVVIAWSYEGPVAYAKHPFEPWAESKCGSIATRTVQQHISTVFGAAEHDITSGMASEDDQRYVTVSPTGSAITRKELVTNLPNHVTVTVVLTGKGYTTDIPVIVGKRQGFYLA
jgi:hypothetical protein